MTLLANGSLNDGSSQYYSSKLQRNDSTQQLLRPFTSLRSIDQLRENYCQNNTKFKINTVMGGPTVHPTGATLALGDPPRSLKVSGESLGYLPRR